MAAEITGITEGSPLEMLSDRELAEETLRVLRSLDATLARLLSAGARGGARGFRQELGQVANGR